MRQAERIYNGHSAFFNYGKGRRDMGKGWRKLLIWLLINIILVVLTDGMTFTYKTGGTISGNGNPGIIMLAAGWLFGIILLCSAGMVLYRLFRLKSVFSLPSLAIAVSALIVLPLAIWLETGYVDALRVHLRVSPEMRIPSYSASAGLTNIPTTCSIMLIFWLAGSPWLSLWRGLQHCCGGKPVYSPG